MCWNEYWDWTKTDDFKSKMREIVLAPDFLDGPKVLNGASDLMVAAFGDKGRHARTTVGVASLPSDAAVEVEGVFEVS